MAKWRIESQPGATYGPQGGQPEAGYVTIDLLAVTEEGTPIPGKRISGLPLPHAAVTAALATGTNVQKAAAIKAVIKAALPPDWAGELIVGYEDALDAAAALNAFIVTVKPNFPSEPLDFAL